MPDKVSNKDRLKEITDSIETGIKELFASDKYQQYLQTMSRFHKYSVNNTMLIYMQKPDATLVAGFNKWHDQFERNVNKGERGIKIIAPTPYKKKIEKEKLDPDTRLPMLDADGKVIMEEKEIKIPMYKPVTVFDVSQTSGKPLPQLASTLTGDVQNYEVFMEAVKRSAPVPISFKPLEANTDGFFDIKDQSITIREGMSEVQTVCAAVHEIAHSKLHNYEHDKTENNEKYQTVEIFDVPALFSNGRVSADKIPEGMYRYDLRGSDDDPGMPICIEPRVVVNQAGTILVNQELDLGADKRRMFTEEEGLNFTGGEQTINEYLGKEPKKDRRTEEVEAESISYAVCAYYGIPTGENSFGYIATWSKDKELSELRASLETISKTSSELITDIDRNYAEIMKERGEVEKTDQIEQEPATAFERLYTVDNMYLHVQRSDEGFDYTLYDKETKREIDGGQLDSDKPLIMDAALEICALHELGGEASLQLADIGILDELQNDEVKAWEDDHVQSVEIKVEEVPEPPEEKPDPVISKEAMNSYGYLDDNMVPLTRDRALELFDRDVPVYLLYTDNTEAMAFDADEIKNFDGMFGVAAEDWERLQEPAVDYESRFRDSAKDGFMILQLKEVPENAQILFENMDYLEKNNLSADYGNYHAVYSGDFDFTGKDRYDAMNDLYMQFNIQHPQDFTGHSLSVSDIIVLRQQGQVSSHYVDSWGFKELPQFLPDNYLKNAEMAMEDDLGMIDGIINNGPKEIKAKEERPSVLEKLKGHPTADRQEPHEKTAPKKSAERER